MAIRVTLILLVLAGIAGGVAWALNREQPIEVTAATVARGSVEQTVAAIASGTIMPAQRAMLAVGAIGTIKEVHVKDGDRVTAGQLLVELEHAELSAQVELAQANLRMGEARLSQAKIAESISESVTGTQARQAAAQLDAARAEFERVKPLAEREAISKSDFEQATLALRVAQEAFSAANATGRETEVRAEDIASAEAMMDQLRAAVKAAEAMESKAIIRAPFDGVVAKVFLEKGEAVAMGVPVAHIVDDSHLYIEAPFDEANIADMSVGQPVRIEVDAYNDRTFSGKVTYIAPFIQPNQDLARTLNVKVDIDDVGDLLIPGMSADVTIIADSKDDVVYAPSESLIRDQYAYIIIDGKAAHRDVELGIGNWSRQEVVSGLKEGEMLITSVGVLGLEDGTPVTVVEELGR
ncbi:MAG: efflux RND transporter periplasmic adaptor subunit [Candidatus Hydrogenedens sp.]|nr:efflux RND transporter periplasmic adaptor subunit [Candidatus Hydrogenedens sp.]